MIARAGDVVVLALPRFAARETFDNAKEAAAAVFRDTGVRLVFVPHDTKSPEPEGLPELVAAVRDMRDNLANLATTVERVRTAGHFTGPR